MSDALAERIAALVAPELAAIDASLYDVEHVGDVLRVVVDRSKPVDLDELAVLTRAISHLLDEHDPVSGRYTLEVSSPGLERRLRTPAHFGAAAGEKVKIKLRAGVEGDRRVTGVITTADADTVTLALPADAGDPTDRRIPLADIEQARTVFEWGPAPRPTRSGTARARSPHSEKEKKAAS
jgi:ribosome maturation factor RimP